MKSKKWTLICLLTAGLILALAAALTAVVDPLFHFHAPLEGMSYAIYDERYQNDGIVRHFDYDAVITGTSMTENFKTSQFDELFGTKAVKVSYSGATFRELRENLERAFKTHPDIKYVLFSLDQYCLVQDKDALTYEDYPTYLYDDKPLNDVNYLLNKDVLLGHMTETLAYTLYGWDTTSFDEYANWMKGSVFGKEAVLAQYDRPEQASGTVPFSPEDREVLRENLEHNILDLAAAHPDTEFYLFFPPYSVVWWDMEQRLGSLDRQTDIQLAAAEQLLTADNIRLFSFCDDFGVTGDLSLYKDIFHFNEDISARLLDRMAAGEHELTAGDLEDYGARLREWYGSYDYDGIFEEKTPEIR